MKVSRAQLRRILTGSRWKGTLNGELVFTAQGDVLLAQLVRPDGSSTALEASEGLHGTVTLVLRQRIDQTVDTHTFYGALTADHKTLKGTFERVRRAGTNSYETEGVWSVSARPAAP